MKVPEGVTVYGSGRQKFKAGQELPVHMVKVKGMEKTLEKCGEKYAKGKADAKAREKKKNDSAEKQESKSPESVKTGFAKESDKT